MGKHERLVIVDDDPQVLKLLKKTGERKGHQIVGEAMSRVDVLDLLHNAELDFSVGIVDGLHGQGKEVAKFLKGARPDATIIAHTTVVDKPFGDILVKKPDPEETLWEIIAKLQHGHLAQR